MARGKTATPTPVGRAEIAEHLGVALGTVDMWRYRSELGFPEPRWTVGGRPCWDLIDVTAWAKETGRL